MAKMNPAEREGSAPSGREREEARVCERERCKCAKIKIKIASCLTELWGKKVWV